MSDTIRLTATYGDEKLAIEGAVDKVVEAYRQVTLMRQGATPVGVDECEAYAASILEVARGSGTARRGDVMLRFQEKTGHSATKADGRMSKLWQEKASRKRIEELVKAQNCSVTLRKEGRQTVYEIQGADGEEDA